MKTKLKQLIKSSVGIILLVILYAIYLPFGVIRSLIDKDWITDFVETAADIILALRKAIFGKVRKQQNS